MSTNRTSANRTKSRAPSRAEKPQREKPSVTGLRVASPGAKLYVNRELSLLAFQRRVLEEAEDPHNPLLERVKFMSIFGSNLEEFFMVRVAGLQRQSEGGLLECGPDGMPPKEQLKAIRQEVLALSKQPTTSCGERLCRLSRGRTCVLWITLS